MAVAMRLCNVAMGAKYGVQSGQTWGVVTRQIRRDGARSDGCRSAAGQLGGSRWATRRVKQNAMVEKRENF